MFGIDGDTLDDGEVDFLALGTVGGQDKIAIRLSQAVRGVPVRGGAVNVLVDGAGDLLSLSSSALADLGDFDTIPSVSARRARNAAIADFQARLGAAPDSSGEPLLVIVKEKLGKAFGGSLAWELELRLQATGAVPEVWMYRVAAQGSPRIVERENRVHDLDTGGSVRSFASPGLEPDSGSNPPVSTPVPFARVTSSAGTVISDENGAFVFPGVEGPLAVTVSFDGPYAHVLHAPTGTTHSITQTITGSDNTLLLNPSPFEDNTSQANVFLAHNRVREFIHTLDPSDATADFPVRANVNIADACNAYFDGSSTNYFHSGDGCVNTGYSTIVAHEMGHFLNQLYGSGNGGDGFGEGAADVWAMYIYDTPTVGAGLVNGGFIRTGLNTRAYCGDGNSACYGAVHADGEPLGGALWKTRRNLNDSLGNDLGDALADGLFLSWMNAFDQSIIDSVIEIQWLILDDDDGLIENGTPHYTEIDAAFREQGFPGYDLPSVLFTNVTQLEDGVDDVGPYGLSATMEALGGGDIASASVHYALNPMTGTSQTGSVAMTRVAGTNEWLALLPGFPAPAVIEYTLEALTTDAQIQDFPSGEPYRFRIGHSIRHAFYDFEGGDDGWSHEELATQDDWQRNIPTGESGNSHGTAWSDPTAASSGTRCWGNDLGIGNFNGAYAANVSNKLRSPSFDLTGTVGTELRLQRWLTVEEGIYDRAQILVNGTVVWENPTSGHFVDTAWTAMHVDISSVADGVGDVVIEFTLKSDGGLELGGWNIDDFEITSLVPAPTDCMPTSYGVGLAGTTGIPSLDTAGQATSLGNGDFEFRIRNARPNAAGALLFGSRQISLPWAGGILLALPELVFGLETDVFGQARLPLGIPASPSLLGVAYFAQAIVLDPIASAGFALTGGLALSPCDR